MATVKIFFDGVEKECLVQVDDNGEILCIARDRTFVKFPAVPDGENLDTYLAAQIEAHNADESNVVVPVSGEEAAAKKAELDNWLDPVPEVKSDDTPMVPGTEGDARVGDHA